MNHNLHRRWIGGALAAGMLATSVTGVLAVGPQFTDIENHWAKQYITSFAEKGYISGYGDDTFRPDANITRAEFAVLLNKAFHLTKESADIDKYVDADGWYRSQLAIALEAGYMVGDGVRMNPNASITRQEAFSMLNRLLKLAGDADALADYPDRDDVASWAVNDVAALLTNKIVNGKDGKLAPTGNLTRAEATTILYLGTQNSQTPDEDESIYVLMNIPYDAFYEAELNNDVSVDSITSATKAKTMTGSLVGGSYHVSDDGSDITGITFPVKVSADVDLSAYHQVTDSDSVEITVTNRGQSSTTVYEGSDALFQNDSYAYYVLEETPDYYKELTVNADGTLSFGEVVGEAQTVTGGSAVLSTSTNYGDYQINVMGLDEITAGEDDVYAVILSTEEGNDYGLRHLENVWRVTELAWCTGFTQTVHNSPTSSDHYVAMMGQTINQITYYTSKGIYVIDCDLYVPVKFDGSVSVDETDVSAGSAAVNTTNLPEDYQAAYTVTGGLTMDGDSVIWTSALPGSYTLTATDESGKYASISTSFQLTTADVVTAYDSEAIALVAAEGVSDEAFANYLSNISSVTVNGTEYAASGRNAVAIINENGFVDLSTEPFQSMKAGEAYTITVSASCYTTDLTFTVIIPDQIYAYAALSYGEYWAGEAVFAAGSEASSEQVDSRSEADLGAFDAVSRATTNHGWHRGSFQQDVVIHTDLGDLSVSYWKDSSTVVLDDGTEATWDKDNKTLTYTSGRDSVTAVVSGYENQGIKYVPVAIPAESYQSFLKAYTVTQNGETLEGGYSEGTLSAYSEVAYVTANTNGLKAATLTGDTWSFGLRQTGTDSGVLGVAQLAAENVTADVKSESQFGDFLRVDLTGDGYGALGSRMQTVLWTYYGNDSTYTNAVASYGTKFASDNWMHKSMGIQLGLTESLRCQLPDGMDGSGYWTVTVYALGYADYTVQVEVTADDLHSATTPMTDAQRTQLTELKDQAGALLENYDAASASDALKTLKEHYDEAVALLADPAALKSQAAELINELPALIEAASKTEETPSQPDEKPTQPTTLPDGTYSGTAVVKPASGESFEVYTVGVNVTLADGKITEVTQDTSYAVPSESNVYNMMAFMVLPSNLVGKTAEEVEAVDGVSGATRSSTALKAAVQDALTTK